MLGETKSPPPAATQLPPQQQRSPLPPGMQLPPGAMPPPHGPGQPGPPHPGMPGYAGQLPPGMMPPGMHMGPPPPGAPFPPHGMQHMGPMPPGMQHGPPPPGMQYRPPGGAGMQYRPPSVLPPQPGMPPGMQHPQPGQQAQQAQQNALLAQLLAAQAASRGAPPQQQHVQPGQQINLAALLGAAGNPGMQLPPMPQTALNPAQLQGLHGLRPPGGMLVSTWGGYDRRLGWGFCCLQAAGLGRLRHAGRLLFGLPPKHQLLIDLLIDLRPSAIPCLLCSRPACPVPAQACPTASTRSCCSSCRCSSRGCSARCRRPCSTRTRSSS